MENQFVSWIFLFLYILNERTVEENNFFFLSTFVVTGVLGFDSRSNIRVIKVRYNVRYFNVN